MTNKEFKMVLILLGGDDRNDVNPSVDHFSLGILSIFVYAHELTINIHTKKAIHTFHHYTKALTFIKEWQDNNDQ